MTFFSNSSRGFFMTFFSWNALRDFSRSCFRDSFSDYPGVISGILLEITGFFSIVLGFSCRFSPGTSSGISQKFLQRFLQDFSKILVQLVLPGFLQGSSSFRNSVGEFSGSFEPHTLMFSSADMLKAKYYSVNKIAHCLSIENLHWSPYTQVRSNKYQPVHRK